MNEFPVEIVEPTEIKHFVIGIDPVTGEEVRIEVSGTGEFSQDVEDAPEATEPAPTVH